MTVSFVVIAYNEEKSLPRLLEDVKAQTYPKEKTEIVLVDGNSADGTKGVMEDFAKENPEYLAVKVLDNPKKLLAAGWNVALKNLTGEAVLRIDAHAKIPPEFIQKNVEVLRAGEDISCGKVENFSVNPSKWGDAVNTAENSMFGGSFASFRRAEKAGYVSTGAFAAYKKEVFEKAGYFNENLARTEDNEMHYRMRKAGYKFYYTPDIVSSRETRNSFKKLVKQKYGNGYWIGLTTGICPQCFSLYHFIPFVFVLGILGTSVLAAFGIWQLAALMWGAYALFTLASTAVSMLGNEFNPFLLLLPVMFLTLHLAYGVGTLIGVLKMPFWKGKIKKA